MQRLECGKLFEDCPAVVEAETTNEILAQAAAHVSDAHGIETLDPTTIEALKGAIEEA